jgi:glycerol kinase
MPGGAWGFVKQTTTGAITAPAYILLGTDESQSRHQIAEQQKSSRMAARTNAHAAYWKRHSPRTAETEQWRYDTGFHTGWNDAAAFFSARSYGYLLLGWDQSGGEARKGADVIGSVDLWILKRLVESQMIGSSEAWKYEHGMRDGIREFREAVGV